MIILNINPNIKTQSNIPICRNIVINDVTAWNNYFNNTSNKFVNTFKKILDNINETDNVFPKEDLFKSYVDQFTNSYNIILNIKKCSNGLFIDLTPDNKQIIYPFLDLIREYVVICINTLNKYFVPALNKKLKDGQKIIVDSSVIIDTTGGPIVPMGQLGDDSLVPFPLGSKIIQGVGATTS
jgi:hypothetical protein